MNSTDTPPRTPLLTMLLLTIFLVTPLDGQSSEYDPLERGRTLTEAFYSGEIDVVVEAFDAHMVEAIGGEEGLSAFRSQVRTGLGPEAAVLSETVTEEAGYTIYRRVVRFERLDDPFTVLWAFDTAGRVAGFSIRADGGGPAEEAPSEYLEHETRTALRLPFEGEWMVFWGGRSVEENYHAAHVDQRFAYDLVVEVDGARHSGQGVTNEDYHCWGRAILAPGQGTVVAARDGVADNEPGRMNPSVPPGNHVVIDHGNGEYSFLAHLQQGSVTVRSGDVVEPGDTLGLCGNSGNSSEPHLHYHLQDTPRFGDGEGMPALFLDYVADGVPVERGEPVQGQQIRPADSGV